MYLLRKWYIDLLTPGGDYLFLYFAFLRLAGFTFRSLVLHVAPSGAGAPITIPLKARWHQDRAGDDRMVLIGLESGGMRISSEGCRVLAVDRGVSLDLVLTPSTHSGRQRVRIDGPRGSHIFWEPVCLRYKVEGHAQVSGAPIDVRGAAGYADFLESTVLPPEVPVRRLLWGRVHGPASDIVYMHASGLSGTPAWSRLILRSKTFEESDSVLITGLSESAPDKSPANGYLLRAPLPSGDFRMTVRRRKTVQDSGFIDQQNIRLLASLAKRVTRDPRSTKFLSSAEIPSWGKGEFTMIDEDACL